MEMKISDLCWGPHLSFGPGGLLRRGEVLDIKEKGRETSDSFRKDLCKESRPDSSKPNATSLGTLTWDKQLLPGSVF